MRTLNKSRILILTSLGRICTPEHDIVVGSGEVSETLGEAGEGRNRDHVGLTVMQVARFDTWNGCVVATMENEVGPGRQCKKLFSTL